MAKQKDIRAERNGIFRNFHPKTWALFPPDKYGWVEVRDTPPAVPNVVAKALIGRPPKQPAAPVARPVAADTPRANDDVNSD